MGVHTSSYLLKNFDNCISDKCLGKLGDLANISYFTNLDFPEIRVPFPLLNPPFGVKTHVRSL